MDNLKNLIGKRLEITTTKGEVYSGLLKDVIVDYVHIEFEDGSGGWLAKKSIRDSKEYTKGKEALKWVTGKNRIHV